MGSSSRFVKRKTSASTRAGKSPAKPTTTPTPTPPTDAESVAAEAERHRTRGIVRQAQEWRLARLIHALGLTTEKARILEAFAHLRRCIDILEGQDEAARAGNKACKAIAESLRECEGALALRSEFSHHLEITLADVVDRKGGDL